MGKSTLFNALTSGHAACSNYPFTTINPNVGIVAVPDERLKRIAEIFKPPKVTPASIRFVDIAGLVKGASKGEGLGNKFLSEIREVDAVIQLVRLFEDGNVTHTMNTVDPVRDAEIIETELLLADLEIVERMIEKNSGAARTGDKQAKEKISLLEKLRETLSAGRSASELGLSAEELKDFPMLTAKPALFVGNVSEGGAGKSGQAMRDFALKRKAGFVELCVKLESEITELEPGERIVFLEELGMTQTGLEKIILESKKLLNLIAFFTVAGGNEARSWLIEGGSKAPQAAGKIHTDMEKGFIKADVYGFADLAECGSENSMREKGRVRLEGKDYVVKDGDVCEFKFNV